MFIFSVNYLLWELNRSVLCDSVFLKLYLEKTHSTSGV